MPHKQGLTRKGKFPFIVSIVSTEWIAFPTDQGCAQAGKGGAVLNSPLPALAFPLSLCVSMSRSSSWEPSYIPPHLINSLDLTSPAQTYLGPKVNVALLYLLTPWDTVALDWHCGCNLRSHLTWLLGEFLAEQTISMPSITFCRRETYPP